MFNTDGLGFFLILGMISLVVLLITVPAAILYGFFWLLTPRFPEMANWQLWSAEGWMFISSAFFLCIGMLNRR